MSEPGGTTNAAGLYALAWYCALHWGDHLTVDLFADAAEILNQQSPDLSTTHRQLSEPIPLVWVFKSGEFGFSRNTNAFLTKNPCQTHELSRMLLDIRWQFASRAALVSGTLDHDPRLAAFFADCDAPTCQVTFPDGTILRIHAPSSIHPDGKKHAGILLYYIERFGEPQPLTESAAHCDFVVQARQALAAVMQSKDHEELAWATHPTGVVRDHLPVLAAGRPTWSLSSQQNKTPPTPPKEEATVMDEGMITAHRWQEMEERLVTAAKAAIASFAHTHPQQICSCVALACQPSADDFLVCLDTQSNALARARHSQDTILAQRSQEMTRKPREGSGDLEPWQYALSLASRQQLRNYPCSVQLFAYTFSVPGARQWFVGWRHPRTRGLFIGAEDSYLEGSIRLVLWKALERLVAEEAFALLRLSSPCRLGYQFHFEEITVVRFLHWPQSDEAADRKP